MAEYTLPVENGVRVKHGSLARFTVRSGRRVLEDTLVKVENLNGAFTVASIIYNRLAGVGVEWWNPATGERIKRPQVHVRLRAADILRDREEDTEWRGT